MEWDCHAPHWNRYEDQMRWCTKSRQHSVSAPSVMCGQHMFVPFSFPSPSGFGLIAYLLKNLSHPDRGSGKPGCWLPCRGFPSWKQLPFRPVPVSVTFWRQSHPPVLWSWWGLLISFYFTLIPVSDLCTRFIKFISFARISPLSQSSKAFLGAHLT